jgi:hypothetical protein
MQPRREYRRHPRFKVNGKLALSWHDPRSGVHRTTAKCVDVSRSGLSIELPRPLDVRMIVNIQSPDLKISGVASVRSVRPRGMHYIVGVEFVGGLEYTVVPAEHPASSA